MSKDSADIYLGCPMKVEGWSSAGFQTLLDNVRKRISSWQFSMLDQVARLLLVNSILVAIASHLMVLYFFPKHILSALNSCLVKFWWGGCHTKRPVYWRSQELLQQHKSQGGIGFRNVTRLNVAILFKQA